MCTVFQNWFWSLLQTALHPLSSFDPFNGKTSPHFHKRASLLTSPVISISTEVPSFVFTWPIQRASIIPSLLASGAWAIGMTSCLSSIVSPGHYDLSLFAKVLRCSLFISKAKSRASLSSTMREKQETSISLSYHLNVLESHWNVATLSPLKRHKKKNCYCGG